MKVTRTHAIILAILILILSLLVRFLPLSNYSPDPTIYSAGGAYSQREVLRNGHFLTQGEAKEIAGRNVFAAGVLEYSTYPFFPTYLASTQLVAHLEPSTWEFRIVQSLIFAVPILIIAACMLKAVRKGQTHKDESLGRTTILVSTGVVMAYSQLASPFLIDQLGSQGWLFFLFPVYLIFFKDRSDFRLQAVALLFLCLLPAVYFTAASFLLLWLSIVVVYRKVTGTPLKDLIAKTLLFATAYLAYTVLIAISRSTTVIHVFTNLYEQLVLGYTGFSPSSLTLPAKYLVSTSYFNKVKYLVNGLLVITPILLYLIHMKRDLVFKRRHDEIMVAGVLALPIMIGLLFLWLGTSSVVRIPEYGSIMAILAVAILLAKSDRKVRRVILAVAVVTIAVSVSTYVTDENTPYRYLNQQETIAARWMMSFTEANQSTFTDHRLAATFIDHGYLNTTGLVEKESVGYTVTEITNVYYGNDGDAAIKVIKNEYSSEYIFFSKGMMNNAPAVYLYNYPIRQTPQDFLDKYENATSVDKICDNGEGVCFTVQ